jgi:hypothetical protein
MLADGTVDWLTLAALSEPYALDVVLEAVVECADPAYPLVLKCVVLWPEQDVQAEHALEHRRDGERDMLLGSLWHRDPDHPILSSEEQLIGLSQGRIIRRNR